MKFEEQLKNIVNDNLNKLISKRRNFGYLDIEPEMSTNKYVTFHNTKFEAWAPVLSKVMDCDIIDIENKIGYKLPKTYITFLKYKHFYDLYIGECRFFCHPVNKWKELFLGLVFNSYKDYLIAKGYIPFSFSGAFETYCFDTNAIPWDTDHPIVSWDYNKPEVFSDKFNNFETMIKNLDNGVLDYI